ncbi:hypothetical protein [Streptomyces sp. NBC_00233]|uniref:hypothetical protein n=1 Tax=Streptomyces sp. NBC_00233 TaxID=2975686 RepID=UPI0022592984|nr:hypothetical protein [Streptomyces sp. NBC_00233]MCX5233123.1 hypothetical protein [Streptomyces sp. NBC_00233]
MSGLLAEHLKATEVAEIRQALRGDRRIRRGQGHSVRVSAPLALHQVALKQCAALTDGGSNPAGAQGVPRICQPDRCGDAGAGDACAAPGRRRGRDGGGNARQVDHLRRVSLAGSEVGG